MPGNVYMLSPYLEGSESILGLGLPLFLGCCELKICKYGQKDVKIQASVGQTSENPQDRTMFRLKSLYLTET